MPVNVKQIPQQPIVVITITEPYNRLKEAPVAEQQFQALTATIQGTIYRILDVTGWRIPFDDLVNALASDTRGGTGADPRIRSIMVGTSEMAALAAKSMKQKQYGGREMLLFASMDEALAFIDTQLAAR
jgi:hypothetical protein